jgi:hypothetical protein
MDLATVATQGYLEGGFKTAIAGASQTGAPRGIGREAKTNESFENDQASQVLSRCPR